MKNILAAMIVLASTQAFAFDFTQTAVVGVRMNQASAPGVKSNDQTKFDAGVIIHIPMVEGLSLRTGGLLVQKDSEIETPAGATGSVERLFIDVPVAAELGHGIFHWYLGADLAAKISSSCTATGINNCEILDEKSFVVYPIAGIDVAVVDQFNVGGFYEFETEYNKDYKQAAFGLRVGYQY